MLDPSDSRDLHRMHKKLVFATDEQPVYWFIDALRMGFRDGILTPFWRLHVGLFHKVENIAEFQYRVRTVVKIFYTDLDTGELLEAFDNPYTGERREASQPKLSRVSRIFGLNGVERPPRPAPDEPVGDVFTDDSLGPAWIVGDDVWLNADSIRREEEPSRFGQLLQVNDWLTYHGSLTEISDPATTSSAATMNFNDLNTFNHPWIGMKGVQAWSVSRGFGRKSRTVEGMPENWKHFAAETHPELLSPDLDFG